MKILLLGGTGLVGKEVMKQFSEHEIVAPTHAELDIEDTVSCRHELAKGYDLVINATGFNDVDGAEMNEEMALRINGEAATQLAFSCFGYSTPLAHVSTLYVFDDSDRPVPHPLGVYGWTKLIGEIGCRTINPRTYVFRTVRLFGDSGSGKKSFIDLVKSLPDDAPMIVDEFAQPTYVKDFVAEMKRIIDEKKTYATYNIVNAGAASWMDFAREICILTGREQRFVPVQRHEFNRRAGRPQRLEFPTHLRHWKEALKEYLSA